MLVFVPVVLAVEICRAVRTHGLSEILYLLQLAGRLQNGGGAFIRIMKLPNPKLNTSFHNPAFRTLDTL